MDPHLEDGALRAYVLSRIPEADREPVEEHLLVCAGCRARLAGWGEYLWVLDALVTLLLLLP